MACLPILFKLVLGGFGFLFIYVFDFLWLEPSRHFPETAAAVFMMNWSSKVSLPSYSPLSFFPFLTVEQGSAHLAPVLGGWMDSPLEDCVD